MIFQGEEMSIGIRGFTVGYDYYAPERSVCFHHYATGKNAATRNKVKHFWENGDRYKGYVRVLECVFKMLVCLPLSRFLYDEAVVKNEDLALSLLTRSTFRIQRRIAPIHCQYRNKGHGSVARNCSHESRS